MISDVWRANDSRVNIAGLRRAAGETLRFSLHKAVAPGPVPPQCRRRHRLLRRDPTPPPPEPPPSPDPTPARSDAATRSDAARSDPTPEPTPDARSAADARSDAVARPNAFARANAFARSKPPPDPTPPPPAAPPEPRRDLRRPGMPAKLTLHPPQRASRFLVLRDGESLVVGREPESGLVLEDQRVSKRHARLHWSGAGWCSRTSGARTAPRQRRSRPGRAAARTATGSASAGSWAASSALGGPGRGPRLGAPGAAPDVRRDAPPAGRRPRARRLLLRLLESAMELTRAERGFVLLAVPREAARGGGGRLRAGPSRAASASRAAWARSSGRWRRGPVVVSDAQADPCLGRRPSVVGMGLGAVACVPIRQDDEILGVIYVDSREPRPGSRSWTSRSSRPWPSTRPSSSPASARPPDAGAAPEPAMLQGGTPRCSRSCSGGSRSSCGPGGRAGRRTPASARPTWRSRTQGRPVLAPPDTETGVDLARRLAPGTLVGGRYRIVALVGLGGMGVVYGPTTRSWTWTSP